MRIQSLIKILTFVAIALGLTGCVTINVDEDRVFLPSEQHFGSVASGLKIRNEEQWEDSIFAFDHFTVPAEFGDLAMTYAYKRGDEMRPLFLMCMGTSGERYRYGINYIKRAIPDGDVLIFDYPGYNDSGGSATVPDFKSAMLAVSKHLDQRHNGQDRNLILWGHSLGGFVCSEIARLNENVDAVILETTAKNLDAVVAKRIPFLLKPFVRPRLNEALAEYDIAQSLQTFKGPIVVLGAGKDKVLDVKLARGLNTALKAQGNDVAYIEFPAASHSNVPWRDSFEDVVASFLARIEG